MVQEEKRKTEQPPRERAGKENVEGGTEPAPRQPAAGQASPPPREVASGPTKASGQAPSGQGAKPQGQSQTMSGGRGTATVQEPPAQEETIRCAQCGDTFDTQLALTEHNTTAHK